MLVIGNKCDVEQDTSVLNYNAKKLADDFGISYLETSAMDDKEVEDARKTMGMKIMNANFIIKSSIPDDVIIVIDTNNTNSNPMHIKWAL